MPTSESKHQPDQRRQGMAICLSGGGFRATLFHLGALRRLNQLGLLSQISTFSSVSGGSILNGVLATRFPSRPPRLECQEKNEDPLYGTHALLPNTLLYLNARTHERSCRRGSVKRRCPWKRPKPSFSARLGFLGGTPRD